jgi:hypothetical protein
MTGQAGTPILQKPGRKPGFCIFAADSMQFIRFNGKTMNRSGPASDLIC